MTKKIRIVGVPDGEAPDWVRLQWLFVPPMEVTREVESEFCRQFLSGNLVPIVKGYAVERCEALMKLLSSSPAGAMAAHWWVMNIEYPWHGEFIFNDVFCEIVET